MALSHGFWKVVFSASPNNAYSTVVIAKRVVTAKSGETKGRGDEKSMPLESGKVRGQDGRRRKFDNSVAKQWGCQKVVAC